MVFVPARCEGAEYPLRYEDQSAAPNGPFFLIVVDARTLPRDATIEIAADPDGTVRVAPLED